MPFSILSESRCPSQFGNNRTLTKTSLHFFGKIQAQTEDNFQLKPTSESCISTTRQYKSSALGQKERRPIRKTRLRVGGLPQAEGYFPRRTVRG